MNDMRELYQEVILQHKKAPRNHGRLEDAVIQEGHNPLCGDHLVLYVKMDGELVGDIRFEGDGCAISTASASMMTEAVKGMETQPALALRDAFHRLVTREGTMPSEEELGKLAVFSGVWEFPSRIKCATLAWHALEAALRGSEAAVTTE